MKKIIAVAGMSLGILFLAGCLNKNSNQNNTAATPAKTSPAATAPSQTAEVKKGTLGSSCATYKDCDKGLYCVKSVCSNPPSYTKYFDKITVAKMKPEPPGPNNIPVPAAEFKAGAEALEIDVSPKTGVKGEVYYDLINSVTGEKEMTSENNKMKVGGQATGTGFMIPGGLSGDFELNIYFNGELIHTVAVKIS